MGRQPDASRGDQGAHQERRDARHKHSHRGVWYLSQPSLPATTALPVWCYVCVTCSELSTKLCVDSRAGAVGDKRSTRRSSHSQARSRHHLLQCRLPAQRRVVPHRIPATWVTFEQLCTSPSNYNRAHHTTPRETGTHTHAHVVRPSLLACSSPVLSATAAIGSVSASTVVARAGGPTPDRYLRGHATPHFPLHTRPPPTRPPRRRGAAA